MKALVIIPARYGSTRLPGKVLLKQSGKYLLQHTYEQVIRASLVDKIIIAADDSRVVRAVKDFGGESVLTSRSLRSGTERAARVAAKMKYPLVINVQADEPEINPRHIDTVIKLLKSDKSAGIATLACTGRKNTDFSNPNKVKVVIDNQGYALYFSRSPIPFYNEFRKPGTRIQTSWSMYHKYYLRHLGIYGYRRNVLLYLARQRPTPLEQSENLEQLRALEHGIKIRVGFVPFAQVGIDTREDYQAFLRRYKKAF
jgi:3-deoxy-manno-octulosonate cytidylyltransferase (CMP-KDO synthetase)